MGVQQEIAGEVLGWGLDEYGRPTTQAPGDLSRLREEYDRAVREASAARTSKQNQQLRKGRKGTKGPCGGTTWVGRAKIQNSCISVPMSDGSRSTLVEKGRRLSAKKRAQGNITHKDLARMVESGEVEALDITLGGETFRVKVSAADLAGDARSGFSLEGLDILTPVAGRGGERLWQSAAADDRARIEHRLTMETLGNLNPYGGENPGYVDGAIHAALFGGRSALSPAGEEAGPVRISPSGAAFRLLADMHLRMNLAQGLSPAQAVFLAKERAASLSGERTIVDDAVVREKREDVLEAIFANLHDAAAGLDQVQRVTVPSRLDRTGAGDEARVSVPVGAIGASGAVVTLSQHVPLSD